MFWSQQSIVTKSIWVILVLAVVVATALGDYMIAFVGLATLGLTIAPLVMAERWQLKIPIYFYAYIVFFLFGTIFLGEAFDFYNRFWWWDIALHGSSAVGFGIVGVVFTLLMFEGDRYAAPPYAVAIIAFAIALSIGALWEIFEFCMDQVFGTNMQKSGLTDTMTDLMVDTVGAALGAATGFAYLKGRARRGLPGVIAEFLSRNKRFIQRRKRMFEDDIDERTQQITTKLDEIEAAVRDQIKRGKPKD